MVLIGTFLALPRRFVEFQRVDVSNDVFEFYYGIFTFLLFGFEARLPLRVSDRDKVVAWVYERFRLETVCEPSCGEDFGFGEAGLQELWLNLEMI